MLLFSGVAGINGAGERSIRGPLDFTRTELPSPVLRRACLSSPDWRNYYGSPSLPVRGFLFGSNAVRNDSAAAALNPL